MNEEFEMSVRLARASVPEDAEVKVFAHRLGEAAKFLDLIWPLGNVTFDALLLGFKAWGIRYENDALAKALSDLVSAAGAYDAPTRVDCYAWVQDTVGGYGVYESIGNVVTFLKSDLSLAQAVACVDEIAGPDALLSDIPTHLKDQYGARFMGRHWHVDVPDVSDTDDV